MDNNKKSFGEIWNELTQEQRDYLTNYMDRLKKDVKSSAKYNVDDMRKAFLAGRDSKEPIMKWEQYSDMEQYASFNIITSFKMWMHLKYTQPKQ
jgi:molecular chaperone GrpE (heat shock protein)